MKTAIIILSILVLLVVAVVAVLQHPAFGPYSFVHHTSSHCTSSPNWRDGMFQNQQFTPQFTGEPNMLKALRTILTQRNSHRVPNEPIQAVKTDLHSLPKDKDWFVWFGHSSYLFQLSGKRFLVDPLLKMEFPSSLMLKPFAGTDIYTPNDLPEIDCLIITHEHWDHLDYATLRDLRPKVKQVICPLGIGEYLKYWKYEPAIIHEMDWMEESKIANEQKITCLPSRHFSNRFLGGRNQTLWASFLVNNGERKVYIGGDGGYDDRFQKVREQFGKIDLAVMENGQYNPNWAYIHMLPKDLEQAILDMQPEQVITVHHNKFALSTHAWSEPDSVAHSIAERNAVKLLDQPIGTVIYF